MKGRAIVLVTILAVGCGGRIAYEGSGAGAASSGSTTGVSVGDVEPISEDAGADVEADSDCNNDGCLPCVGDSCGQPPSCARGGPGMTNCGAEGNESCCTSFEVTGGTYYRTYMNSGSGPTGEADPASVSSFHLDRYDVTVGRFRQFVNAWNGGNGYTPSAGSGKHVHLNNGNGLAGTGGVYEPGWIATDDGQIVPTDDHLVNACDGATSATWTTTVGSQENLPINCVNWYEAYAFCIWDGGGFLPSEAEWEYAAAGGDQQREYPWGSIDPGGASQYAIYGCGYATAGSCPDVAQIASVGTAALGAGLWGQIDLAGEVFQWTLDWYGNNYIDPCTTCSNVNGGSNRVARGGGFDSPQEPLFPSYRIGGGSPASRTINVGFRCARTP